MVLILYKITNIFDNYMLILHKLTLCFNWVIVFVLFKTYFIETETDYL
ncbi:hypothetical protein SAMN05444407_108223 [Chryseobacterium contaminans]|uniref:Uncharacterized protein n=1 Tax=Chryseobacterium contaminans TaxID=1423959 RepID=A0A1M7FFG7_9FLAO|nr:hypothetical protein SAMN05444407_108223 [Chryseobacterium contaminans]